MQNATTRGFETGMELSYGDIGYRRKLPNTGLRHRVMAIGSLDGLLLYLASDASENVTGRSSPSTTARRYELVLIFCAYVNTRTALRPR